MSRVYVVQRTMRKCPQTGRLEPVHDVGEAGAYGDLVDLVGPQARPFNPDGVLRELRAKLCEYTDDDWLLCIGNPAIIGWAVALACHYNEGRVNVLQWSGTRGRYLPIRALLVPEGAAA